VSEVTGEPTNGPNRTPPNRSLNGTSASASNGFWFVTGVTKATVNKIRLRDPRFRP
jgi:hypothetical protein